MEVAFSKKNVVCIYHIFRYHKPEYKNLDFHFNIHFRPQIRLLIKRFSLGYLHLDAVKGLACSNDPEGYAGENVKFLVGPPMPDRPRVMCQTKRDTPVLQRWGFVGQARQPTNCKKTHMLRQPVRKRWRDALV